MINYYNVPADFKLETIDEYDRLNKKYKNAQVRETYGQITIGNVIGSGRAHDLIPQVGFKELEEYVAYSLSKNILFNYTLNATCMENKEFTEEGIEEILQFLHKLRAIGIDSLTVAMPSLIELVKLSNLDFKIKASTVCQIINANKALTYKNFGVDSIVIDESINRNFGQMERIRNAFGDKTEVITNVICFQDCIYEMFHHNQTSHDNGIHCSDCSATYYSHRCMMKRCESIYNFMKLAWIRPEDIKYYNQIGIHYFKLQGRQAVLKGNPVKLAEAYMKESFDGNLVELLDVFNTTNSFVINVDNKKLDGFLLPFVNNKEFCKHDCLNCNYCKTFMDSILDTKPLQDTYNVASKFYDEYDEFKKSVQECAETLSENEMKSYSDLDATSELEF